MKTQHGSKILPGYEGERNIMRLEYLILMFSPNQHTEMVGLTNREPRGKNKGQ